MIRDKVMFNARLLRLQIIEQQYVSLLSVPNPEVVVHGTSVDNAVTILESGSIKPLTPGFENVAHSHFTLDHAMSNIYGVDVYFVFPFSRLKSFLKPVFYLKIIDFTLTLDHFGFGICNWSAINVAEVYSAVEIPLTSLLGCYLLQNMPQNMQTQRISELLVEKNLKVMVKPETDFSTWTDGTDAFLRKMFRLPGLSPFDMLDKTSETGNLILRYNPEFVVQYNKKLAGVFGIALSDIERAEKEYWL